MGSKHQNMLRIPPESDLGHYCYVGYCWYFRECLILSGFNLDDKFGMN